MWLSSIKMFLDVTGIDYLSIMQVKHVAKLDSDLHGYHWY